MYYLCSLGSNIRPLQHIPAAVVQLSKRLSPITVSAFIQTTPLGIDAEQDFVNGLMWFSSQQSEACLKRFFNQLEDRFGRNRKDPLSSSKSRTLDIDLIGAAQRVEDLQQLTVDPFLAPLKQQLFATQPELDRIVKFEIVNAHGQTLPLGHRTTTVDFN
ncbi:2-amino-4-hydroxy-6-hydroxymethyldihydropteridine diphosphokinase [Agarivorans sp. MS3-6]